MKINFPEENRAHTFARFLKKIVVYFPVWKKASIRSARTNWGWEIAPSNQSYKNRKKS
jgi:hypothetical protein